MTLARPDRLVEEAVSVELSGLLNPEFAFGFGNSAPSGTLISQGIETIALQPLVANQLGSAPGLLVVYVDPSSIAFNAGLRPGDVIESIDGTPLKPLTNGFPGIREALSNFVAAKGTFDLKVTRVLKGGDLALVTGEWSLVGTGPDGQPMKLAAKSADVLRRQKDGTWRFVIDNPWGTD